MNPPQVYMCSPSWTLLPPPSLFHPSGSSQCTSPKHPVSWATLNGNPTQYSCLENPMDGGAWCRLLSMGLQRVGHDWATSLSLCQHQERDIGNHSRGILIPLPFYYIWADLMENWAGKIMDQEHGRFLQGIHFLPSIQIKNNYMDFYSGMEAFFKFI